MIWIIIILAIVAIIAYNVTIKKKDREREQQEEEKRKQLWAERKQNGEPLVCEALHPGAPAVKEMQTGPDGKSYSVPKLFASDIVRANIGPIYYSYQSKENQYEYNPVYCMLAYEYYIESFLKSLKEKRVQTDAGARQGILCIYELAEGYAYPVPARDDLTHATHYTLRRLADRKRAMEGNGYWKNAYDFPIDAGKALVYYELAEAIRENFKDVTNHFSETEVFYIINCWLQIAHFYSAGLHGVEKDDQKAKKFYSQAFQMAMHYKKEDMAMEIALALSQGYPRDPVYYQENLHNMLMDWACGSDLGLAMYAEYIWNIDKLDRERLAKSPEEAVKLYMEQAKDNFYAAFMAGRAKYYGYGTDKDEAKGRELIELAAGSGCVPALYLMTQLSLGNPEAEGKWKAELDSTVAAIAEKCAFMREELEKAGKSVTKKWMEDFQSRQAQQAATGQPQKGVVSEEPDWEAPASERKQESGWDTPEKQSFQFPQYLYSDGDREEVWELMNSGYDNATYYCQKTGGQVSFYASDFEGGTPNGFTR